MRAWVFTAMFSLLSAACGMDSGASANLPSTGGTGGTGGDAASAGAVHEEPVPSSLEFEVVDELPARHNVMLVVRARPAGVYHVRFTLPSSAPDVMPLDAVLDASAADTNTEGLASVGLTTPSSPTTFQVRASVGQAISATLPLVVKDTGFGQIQVEPRYGSALRYPTTWVASAHPGKTCTELPGIPPPDGPVLSPPAGQNEAPLLTDVPAGIPLAITLRSGHFVGGCASVSALEPGSQQTVTVPVLNRPIDLSASKLSLKLDMAPEDAAWTALLGSAQQAALNALPGTSVDDVDALLDAMREAAGDDRQPFETARQNESWDALLQARWGVGAKTRLRDLVVAWLNQAQKDFLGQSRLLEGAIEPDSQSDASAHLSVLTVAGLSAAQATFASPALWTWSASADDNLTMATDLYLFESQLLTTLAEAVAVAAATDAQDAPAALAEALDCSGASVELAAAGQSPSLAYGSCDAMCLDKLCRQGLRAVWLRTARATALSPSRLTVAATGHAFVGDAAEVAGMTGSWLGELSVHDTKYATSGSLTATSAP